ncbi:MAG: carboxypeptidase-like regulatory domain-containing protein, partial [Fusobacteriaceae bacterium]
MKNKDMNIGGIQIEFVDSENKIVKTETNIYGVFSIILEPKSYKIFLKDYSLTLLDHPNKIYDFTDNKNRNPLTLEASFKNGFISGKIVDSLNNSIPFSKVSISSKEFSEDVVTDEFGYFSIEIPPGIFKISAFNGGFIRKSIVRNLLPASSIPNISLKLDKSFFSLSGCISDGVNSLENIEVKLISKKGEIIKRIYTSEKGNFFLDHISDSFYIL